MEGLTIGRVVHVYTGDGEYPATVTRVWDKERGLVDLFVMTMIGFTNLYATYSDVGHTIHTWHWPERA